MESIISRTGLASCSFAKELTSSKCEFNRPLSVRLRLSKPSKSILRSRSVHCSQIRAQDADLLKDEPTSSSRRSFSKALGLALFSAPLLPILPAKAIDILASNRLSSSSVDTTITDKVFLDFSLCPTATRLDRTLGDMSLICKDGEPLGRVVIGLYGNQVPKTVEHFKQMVSGSAGSTYKDSIIHKILPGQYILAGRQGSREKGEVEPPSRLDRNLESVSSKAFQLSHFRPGTVSLCLGDNDDEDDIKLSSDYRNVEFLITTGPGPATQLDNENIVFGTVLEGMGVITRVSEVPTYRPNEQIQQFNQFASLLGDERAAKGRSFWNKPLKAVVISDCGILS